MAAQPSSITAVLLAGGRGQRLGADKALIRLGPTTAVERAVAACRTAGIGQILIVRRPDAAPLPLLGDGTRVLQDAGPEMIDSLRAALAAIPADTGHLVLLPIDHAMVEAGTIATLLVRALTGPPRIRLPLHDDRPGHPVLLPASLLAEIQDPSTMTLRDVIRRDPARVEVVPVADPWVLRDLDTPADLAAAVAHAAALPLPPTALMRAHRSRRAFHPDPIPAAQLERLVDAARHAATSSLMQAYAVVAVDEPEHKARIARLCGDQVHIHEAPLFLAICADLHRIALACTRHGRTFADETLEVFVQATIDAALVGQNLLLGAESEGLGGCFLGAARNHPTELAAELGLPPHVFVAFGLVLGVPADDPVPRGRMPLSGILHHDRYDLAAAERALDGADEQMRSWAARTNAERGGYQGRAVNEQKGWADRMADLWSRERANPKGRAHLLAALRQLGFPLQT